MRVVYFYKKGLGLWCLTPLSLIFQLYRDKKGMSKWVVVVELQISNFSAISWREHDSVGWNDDNICFVLDQHAELDFYSETKVSTLGPYLVNKEIQSNLCHVTFQGNIEIGSHKSGGHLIEV